MDTYSGKIIGFKNKILLFNIKIKIVIQNFNEYIEK